MNTCKYEKYRKMASYDNGETWQALDEYQRGELIEYDSVLCGGGGTEPPTSNDFLRFIALEDGTFSFYPTSGNVISYSLDSGETWTELSSGASTPTIQSGETVFWKGNMSHIDTTQNGIGYFKSTGRFDVEGNIMSLLYGNNFIGKTNLSDYPYVFQTMFAYFSSGAKVVNAENLILPATTLSEGCYASMFLGNSTLETAPQLPATTLADKCYAQMFYGCTSLTSAPQLSATTLASRCYNNMFANCYNLTTVPELPATTLADYCYYGMFGGCISLNSVPTDLLPATTLEDYCYSYMFKGCSGLTSAPELPATTLENMCYANMFKECTSLTTAPQLLATTLVEGCYQNMFDFCHSLSAITCLATDISASVCTFNWVNYVAQGGAFTKAASMTGWTIDSTSGVPIGWSVQDY